MPKQAEKHLTLFLCLEQQLKGTNHVTHQNHRY